MCVSEYMPVLDSINALHQHNLAYHALFFHREW